MKIVYCILYTVIIWALIFFVNDFAQHELKTPLFISIAQFWGFGIYAIINKKQQ